MRFTNPNVKFLRICCKIDCNKNAHHKFGLYIISVLANCKLNLSFRATNSVVDLYRKIYRCILFAELLCVFHGFSRRRLQKNNHVIMIFFTWGLVILLLLTLLSVESMRSRQPFEYDDVSPFESSIATWHLVYLALVVSGFYREELVLIQVCEHLSGHIGEKRIDSSTVPPFSPSFFDVSFVQRRFFIPSARILLL